jgi:hypothetical protein
VVVWIPEKVGRLYSAYYSTSATNLRRARYLGRVHRKALKWSYVIHVGAVKYGRRPCWFPSKEKAMQAAERELTRGPVNRFRLWLKEPPPVIFKRKTGVA